MDVDTEYDTSHQPKSSVKHAHGDAVCSGIDLRHQFLVLVDLTGNHDRSVLTFLLSSLGAFDRLP